MHTVPRRPAGGSQRAKRSATPSGVLSVPATKLSGTGFAGIETSFMRNVRAVPSPAYNSLRVLLNLARRFAGRRAERPRNRAQQRFSAISPGQNNDVEAIGYSLLRGRMADTICFARRPFAAAH